MHKTAKQVLSEYKSGQRNFRNLNLDGEKFDDQDLSGADFSKASLLGTSFRSANLRGCNFSQVKACIDLKEVLSIDEHENGHQDSSNLNLDDEKFDNQDLSSADFSKASLLGTSFRSANLRGCNFSQVKAGIPVRRFLPISLLSLILSLFLGAIAPFVGYAAIYFFLPESFSPMLGSGILSLFFITLILIRYKPVASIFLGVGAIIAGGTFALQLTHILGKKSFQKLCLCLGAVASTMLFLYLKNSISSSINNGFLRLTALAPIMLSPIFLRQAAVKGIDDFDWIRVMAIDFVSWFGTSFKGAELQNASFRKAKLYYANFVNAKIQGSQWLGVEGIKTVSMIGHYLKHTEVQDLAISGNGEDTKFIGLDLTGINLENAKLEKSNFTGSILNEAILKGANLSHSHLTKTQLINADLTSAILTGAVIEDWSTNSETKLEEVFCEYIHFRQDYTERRPSSGYFKLGEFATLVRKGRATVDLIFRDGIDWQAFFKSLQELRASRPGEDISVQAIERKGDAFVVHLDIGIEAEKAAIQAEMEQLYEGKLAALKTYYEEELRIQSEDLAEYKKNQSSFIHIIQTMAEKSSISQNFHGPVGNVSGNNYGLMIANINQNRNSISQLITKLEASAQDFPSEQKEEVLMELDDLKTDLNEPRKQEEKRIKKRLQRLIAAGTAAITIAGGAAAFSEHVKQFTENVFELGEKIGLGREDIQMNP